ncbi:MAG: NosD domain-containing protein [Nanoarchaeota archaeon]
MKKHDILISALFLILFAGFASAINCGDTIAEDITLTEDLLNCPEDGIIIGANDITLDCDNHLITGSGENHGIYLGYRDRVTIKNCKVQNFNIGIYLLRSSENTVSDNELKSNAYSGISVRQNSDNNIISGNNLINNSFNGIIVVHTSNNNVLSENTANKNGHGISVIYYSYNNTLSRNTLNKNSCGIILDHEAESNVVSENTANNNRHCGILIVSSFSNVLTDNTLNNNGDNNRGEGVYFYRSFSNILSDNVINNNLQGIKLLTFSNNNTFTGNTIKNNNNQGAHINNSQNNLFYANTFRNNNVNAYETTDSVSNIWNLSEQGNCWSDFRENPGFPDYYDISGPGDGIDWWPCGKNNVDVLPVENVELN